jgi:hypothetical protein
MNTGIIMNLLPGFTEARAAISLTVRCTMDIQTG